MRRIVTSVAIAMVCAAVVGAPKLFGSAKGTGATRAEACDASVRAASTDMQNAMDQNRVTDSVTGGEGKIGECACSEPDAKLPKYLQRWTCQTTWTLNYR